jgi:hypothetical protein
LDELVHGLVALVTAHLGIGRQANDLFNNSRKVRSGSRATGEGVGEGLGVSPALVEGANGMRSGIA